MSIGWRACRYSASVLEIYDREGWMHDANHRAHATSGLNQKKRIACFAVCRVTCKQSTTRREKIETMGKPTHSANNDIDIRKASKDCMRVMKSPDFCML